MDTHVLLGRFREIEKRILRNLLSEESPGPVFPGVPFEPCIDVFETAEGIVVRLEIAGMKRKDIVVEFEGDTLTIRGRRVDRSRGARLTYHQMEIDYGEFERRVRILIPVRAEEIAAAYRDGFLEVRLPFRRKAGGRTRGE